MIIRDWVTLGYHFRGTHAVRFIHLRAPGCLAAAAGLVTPLRTCPVDRVAQSIGLRHGRAPNARPPAPNLPLPRVDLAHVAPSYGHPRRLRRRFRAGARCP